MSGRGVDVTKGAVKTVGFGGLSFLLSTMAGGISAAPSASGQPHSATPVSSSSAANRPSLETPKGDAARETPPGHPRNSDSAPMPAPAPN